MDHKWPKSTVFIRLLYKAKTIFKNCSQIVLGGEHGINKYIKHKKDKKSEGGKKNGWNFSEPKEAEPKTKKFGENTYHSCCKEYSKYKNTMNTLRTPEECTCQTPNTTLKTDDLKLELNDELRSLLLVYQKNF